jgi:hypothetical protein
LARIRNPDSFARRIALLPIVACVLFVAFQARMFARYNAAPPLDGPAVEGDPGRFRHAVELCRSSASKVSIAGWIARPGLYRPTHRTTAVLRDDRDGRFYGMKTDLPTRRDVTTRLNAALGDRVNYENSGFAASLDVVDAGLHIAHGQVYVAFEEAGRYTLLPMPCTYSNAG